jgi:hypothetical protein
MNIFLMVRTIHLVAFDLKFGRTQRDDRAQPLLRVSLRQHVLHRAEQPVLCGERLPQCHRCGLAIASIASHNTPMTPELSDDDKAILLELLRETIARDRFPLSPRVRSFKAILDKLASPTPRPEPLPPPKPPGERSMALMTNKRL